MDIIIRCFLRYVKTQKLKLYQILSILRALKAVKCNYVVASQQFIYRVFFHVLFSHLVAV